MRVQITTHAPLDPTHSLKSEISCRLRWNTFPTCGAGMWVAFASTPKRCRLPGKRCRFEESISLLIVETGLRFATSALSLVRIIMNTIYHRILKTPRLYSSVQTLRTSADLNSVLSVVRAFGGRLLPKSVYHHAPMDRHTQSQTTSNNGSNHDASISR